MACQVFEIISGVLVCAAEEIKTAKVGRRVKKSAETAGLAESLLNVIARMKLSNLSDYTADKAGSCVQILLRLGSTIHVYVDMADQIFVDVDLDARMLELSHARRQRASGTITSAFDAFCALAD
ncbi:hypothetical protein B0H10DRAFT_2213915 [Mycena sp. CBHHK59/15]|nr:hypothetical protein B0H10DRAFT_2213915 [Mycena sp. CBHHK59/15]